MRKIAIYCPFCHKHVVIEPARGVIIDNFKKVVLNSPYSSLSIWNKTGFETWWIGVCPGCENGILIHEISYPSEEKKIEVFPTPIPSPSDKRIPEAIRKDLDEAKKCFQVEAFRACAVMARRAIETACIEKGADQNKRLVDKIKELSDKGIITKEIKEWADSIRWIGNDAAHPTAAEVTKEDAEDILKLAEQFLHVLFVTPAIARDQRTKRKK